MNQEPQSLDPSPEDFYGTQQDQKAAEDLFITNNTVKLVKTYLEEDMPEDLKKHQLIKDFWAVLGKTPKLTFLEPDDVDDFEQLFTISESLYIMQKPAYDYTFGDSQKLSQIKMYFLAALRRSVGAKQHRFNERTILGGQIRQEIRTNTEQLSSKGGGFLSRWF